jgi:hypothetical protein
MNDTDANGTDFTLTGCNFVTIHNSTSAINTLCSPVPTSSRTWGQVKTIYR